MSSPCPWAPLTRAAWVLVGAGLALSLWAQFKVKGTFAKYAKMPTSSRMTGADVARRILAENHIDDVRVERVPGEMTDHYDPKSKVLRLSVGEFMRRFLLHVLPEGFHRIRHYGLFANGHRAEKLARCRELLGVVATSDSIDGRANADDVDAAGDPPACPCCGGELFTFDGTLLCADCARFEPVERPEMDRPAPAALPLLAAA